jgi:hypothetical protein
MDQWPFLAYVSVSVCLSLCVRCDGEKNLELEAHVVVLTKMRRHRNGE